MSQEDVLPLWLDDAFPRDTKASVVRRHVTHQDDDRHEWDGKLLGLRTGKVCRACNNGWLSDLENATKPILLPLINGHVRMLTATEQARVAIWATKTLLTMQGTNPRNKRVTSTDQAHWFYEHRQPLPGSIVWLFRYADYSRWPVSIHQYGMTATRKGGAAPQVGDPLNGFSVIYTLAHLGFWLFGVDLPGAPPTHANSDDTYVLVWPTFGPDVRWPPSQAVETEAALNARARLMPAGTIVHGPALKI